ncbi:GntR family transcriptional regulator [Salsipaludibacter albus]|uniref:GntR family transcriptional regulator n=1 Tax=Salsipaludibacter albus TaxID=2849650 RepID=UPI001EE4C061|nr:GntR family transcriptional regulator [Salsipaludibacter albus]
MTDALDRRSDRPAYRQIADQLRSDIDDGDLQPGSKVPSERSLMERYGAARGTVRQALAELRTEGLIEVHHGKGAFVRARAPIHRLAHDRFARRHREEGRAAFLAEMEAEGRAATVEVDYVGAEQAPEWVATALGLDAREEVLVRRRRYLDAGEPIEIATSYLPLEIAAGTAIAEENTGPGGIYARLEDLGHRLEQFTEDVSARMPHPDEARALELAAGVPVVRVVRHAISADGKVLELCDTIKAADRYILSYALPAS